MSGTGSSLRWLRDRGLSPKRSFGQSFLQDEAIAGRIARLATEPAGGSVLEIGAGAGALTEPLLARAARVVAVERDRDLVPLLAERFAGAGHLEIVAADAASIDWVQLLGAGPAPRVVAGNLPYQITGRLVQRAVGAAAAVDRVVFMVQREVAERLVAAPGSAAYGAASVFAQAVFDIAVALRVAAGAFAPMPRVDSAVVVMTPRSSVRAREDDALRALVHRAFAQRRKKLRNAWRGIGDWSAAELSAHATRVGIDLDARGETLAGEDFERMAELLRGQG